MSVFTDRNWKNVGYWAHEGRGGMHRPDATTGPDGTFRFDGLPVMAEPYTLYAEAGPRRAGRVEGVDPFSIPPAGVRIVLRPTLDLSGRVLDSAARPLQATVTLQRPGDPLSAGVPGCAPRATGPSGS